MDYVFICKFIRTKRIWKGKDAVTKRTLERDWQLPLLEVPRNITSPTVITRLFLVSWPGAQPFVREHIYVLYLGNRNIWIWSDDWYIMEESCDIPQGLAVHFWVRFSFRLRLTTSCTTQCGDLAFGGDIFHDWKLRFSSLLKNDGGIDLDHRMVLWLVHFLWPPATASTCPSLGRWNKSFFLSWQLCQVFNMVQYAVHLNSFQFHSACI